MSQSYHRMNLAEREELSLIMLLSIVYFSQINMINLKLCILVYVRSFLTLILGILFLC